jgi:ADP-heptose:LPS heptosyltransferase
MFYSHKIHPPLNTIHLIDYYNQIVSEAGGKTPCTDCRINPPDSAISSISRKLTENGLANKEYAVLFPGSAHQSKCWPIDRFAKIAEKIARQLNLSVIGSGIASENSLVKQIQQHTSVPILNLAGQTDIPELIALLKNARLVISNDTGPGHLAQALKTPTVFIFGHTNPLRVGPYRQPGSVAAIEPTNRGSAIENPNPAYAITQVSEQLVWEKICTIIQPNRVKTE